MKYTLRRLSAALALSVLTVAIATAAASSAGGDYTVTNLVSDQPGHASHVDSSLVNAWGLAALPASPWWVSDNGTDVSTLYNAGGDKIPLTVSVRSAPSGLVAQLPYGDGLGVRRLVRPLRKCEPSYLCQDLRVRRLPNPAALTAFVCGPARREAALKH